MAIRERNGAFQVYWNNPHTGRRESKTFASKHEAEKEDSLIKHRLKFERESFAKEDASPKILTFENAYMAYLKEKQFTKHNLSRHFSAMRQFISHIGQLPLADIDADKLRQLKEDAINATPKLATAHKRLSLLRAVMRWAFDKGLLAVMPAFPKLPPANYEQLIPPTPQELAAMLLAAPPHLQRVIIIGSQCGLRVGPCELFKLTWADVDLDQRILRVRNARKNANSPWREVPIRTNLLHLFEKWQAEDSLCGAICLIHVKGQPVSSIKRAWANALKNAGIARRIRPYDLRHSFATELIAGGVDVGTIAKLMGHSGPTMIFKHYQFVMDSQKRDAIERLPEIANVPNAMCQKEKGALHLQQPLEISGGEKGT